MADKQVLHEMDAAATVAEAELKPEMTLAEVAQWWKRHFAKAGHKRLGRAILKLAGVKES